MSRPLEIMRGGAERFGSGDLAYRLPPAGSKDTAALAEAMNAMAAQLDDQIQTIVRRATAERRPAKHGRRRADPRPRRPNPQRQRRRGRDLQINPAKVRGRFVYEVLRRPALLAFVDKALSTSLPLQEEIAIQEGEPRFLAASGSVPATSATTRSA